MSFKFHRGDYLSDLITGFKGVVVGRSDYLTSCNTYCLQPPVDQDGKHVDAQWFDEHSLEYDPAHLGQKLSLERATEQPPG
jgi:hypothetical protein